MNRNSRNDGKDDEQYVHGLRKITYWEKYGVKRFPYKGSRRYSPCVYQSEDGGIIISNDGFGLTIRQFERRHQAFLDAHEQYILNLRYPDKTSVEYMEYLENSRFYNIDDFRSGNDLKHKYLYKHLVDTVGTEIDIRKRQQLFVMKELIANTFNSNIFTWIMSGSLGEGMNLPGSDIDMMFINNTVDVIQEVRSIKHQLQRTTLVMETDSNHPGFAKLRLIAGGDGKHESLTYKYSQSTRQGSHVSPKKYVSDISSINMIGNQHTVPVYQIKVRPLMLHSALEVNVVLTMQYNGHRDIDINGHLILQLARLSSTDVC